MAISILFETPEQGWNGLYLSDKISFEKSLALLKTPDTIIIENDLINLKIDYPLTTNHVFQLKSPNGFSKRKLANMIFDTYQNIFAFDKKMKEKYQTETGFGSWHTDPILITAKFNPISGALSIDPNS